MEEKIQIAKEQLDESVAKAYEYNQQQQESYLANLYNNDKHFREIMVKQKAVGDKKDKHKDSPHKRAEDLKERNKSVKEQHQRRMQDLKWEQRQQRGPPGAEEAPRAGRREDQGRAGRGA